MSAHLQEQCEAFVSAHVAEITAALKAGSTPGETCESLSEPYCALTIAGTRQHSADTIIEVVFERE